MAKILSVPADFGLGHATRSACVIKELLARGHEVHVATSGSGKAFLNKEFPELTFLDNFPEHGTGLHSAGNLGLVELVKAATSMAAFMEKEHEFVEDADSMNNYDLILADGSYGAYSKRTPSLVISHQLYLKMPSKFKLFEPIANFSNSGMLNNFDCVIVPDNAPGPLSISERISRNTKVRNVYYAGILSSLPYDSSANNSAKDIDVLIVLSGPEPYRTELEGLIMGQIRDIPGDKVLLLGRPDSNKSYSLDERTIVKSHVGRDEMLELMNNSGTIVSRSGYTTLMEVANLGIKRGLFIPTPGCSEQEYLSELMQKNGWFLSRRQSDINIAKDLKSIDRYVGFPDMPKTSENVKRLYDNVLSKYI